MDDPPVHAAQVVADVLRAMGKEMVAPAGGHVEGVESIIVDVEKHWPRGKTCAVLPGAPPGQDDTEMPEEEHDAITLFTPVQPGVTMMPTEEVLIW